MSDEQSYTIEGFQKDSQLARLFLEDVEDKTYNFLETDWRDLTEHEIVDKACFCFHIIMNEQAHAEHLSREGLLH